MKRRKLSRPPVDERPPVDRAVWDLWLLAYGLAGAHRLCRQANRRPPDVNRDPQLRLW